MQKQLSPGVSLIIVLIVLVVVISAGYFIFFRPSSPAAKAAEKAREARATEPQPQPGMVVDLEPEQSLPKFVRVEVVLDRDLGEKIMGNEMWLAHGRFSYRGERAKVEFNAEYSIFTWEVWHEDGETAAGIFQFKQSCLYPTAVGQNIFIEKITWIETTRLTE